MWVWETIRTMDDNTSEQCPKCDSCRTRKVISPISFILKGSGFHDTDYNERGPK